MNWAQEKPFDLPPSPEAAAIGKFIEMPVSKYTGLPDITIPIYETSYGAVKLPITLKYHASGFRPAEDAGWVGLGWALNVGGTISRTVKGYDDLLEPSSGAIGYAYAITEGGNTYDVSNVLGNQPIKTLLQDDMEEGLSLGQVNNICNGVIDAEPDVFYVNFPGGSGKFYLGKIDPNTQIIEGIPVEAAKISIEVYVGGDSPKWTIIDASGTSYYFNTYERTIQQNLLHENISVPGSGGPNQSKSGIIASLHSVTPDMNDPKIQTITAWYLDKIVDANGFEIDLNYSVQYQYRTTPQFSQSKTLCAGYGAILDGYENCDVLENFQANQGYFDIYEKENVIEEYYLNGCLFQYFDNDIGDYLNEGAGFDPVNLAQTVDNIGALCTEYRGLSASLTIRQVPYLESVISNNIALGFEHSERLDIEPFSSQSSGLSTSYQGARKLDTIKVVSSYQGTNKLLQSFIFEYDYYGQTAGHDIKRLKLNQLNEVGQDGEILPYVFDYHSLNPPEKNTFEVDHWGYWNDHHENDTQEDLIPDINYASSDGFKKEDGANRSPDFDAKLSGVLRSIEYPTGGTTSFEYESNSYALSEIATINKRPFATDQVGFSNDVLFDVISDTEANIVVNLDCALFYESFDQNTESDCKSSSIYIDDTYEYVELWRVDETSTTLIWSRFGNDYQKYKSGEQDFDLTHGTYGTKVDKTISLSAGTYQLIVDKESNQDIRVSASVEFTDLVIADQPLERDGPGLRVKKITSHDGINIENDVIKTYDYSLDKSELSSGKLMSEVNYSYQEIHFNSMPEINRPVLVARIKAQSNSTMPMGSSAQGSLIGYSRVTEYLGEDGEFGSTVSYFRNQPDEFIYRLPNSPTVSHQAQNGLPDSIFMYDVYDRPVSKVRNRYLHQDLPESPVAVYIFGREGCDDGSMFLTNYLGYSYTNKSDWWYKEQTEQQLYSSDGLGTQYHTSEKYYYDNPHHKQITRTERLESGRMMRVVKTNYPLDVPALAPPEMWDEQNPDYKHVHNTPVQITEYINDEMSQGKLNGYIYEDGQIRYKSSKSLYSNDLDVPDFIVDEFNPRGQPRGITNRDGSKTVLIWGYNYQHIVAELNNAQWSQITNLLTSQQINNIESGNADNVSVRSSIDVLRQGLSSAFVNTFLYEPGLGISEVVDMNGRSTYYDYENNRLRIIKDFEHNILQRIEYQYANELSNP